MQLVKLFSRSLRCHFGQMTVRFAMQKPLSFMRSHLLTVDLSVYDNSAQFRKSFPRPVCSRLVPTFSSIRFSLSGFLWRSLTYLDLSLVWDDKYESICLLLLADIQFDQHHLLKMLSFFFLVYIYGLFLKKKNQITIGVLIYVWVFNFYFINQHVCFCAYTMRFFFL